jgi:hypothetical protein
MLKKTAGSCTGLDLFASYPSEFLRAFAVNPTQESGTPTSGLESAR